MKTKCILSFVLAIMVSVLSLSLVGCSARNPIDADAFQTAAEAAGYTVEEIEAQSPATGTLLATLDNTEIYFYTTNSGQDAQSIYAQTKAGLESGGSKGQALDSDTYCKYSISTGDLYYHMVRNGSTLVFAKAPAASQSSVESFFESIHY